MERTWVIGGARGIGAEIVRVLAAEQREVVFTYNSSEDIALQLASDLSSQGLCVSARKLDLTSPVSLDAVCSELAADNSSTGLVVCAAAKYDTLLALAKIKKVEDVFNTNVLSTIKLVQASAKPMMRKRYGRIILTSSIATKRNHRGNSIYAATKGALESFCKSVANELAPRGVTINCVAPGFINTEIMKGYGDTVKNLAKSLPARRMGTTHEVAAAFPFLLSKQAAYINGATLVIDGGATGSFSVANF